MGLQRVGHHLATEQQQYFDFSLEPHHLCFGEGNGNPLQYSCLEDPMDGGAW